MAGGPSPPAIVENCRNPGHFGRRDGEMSNISRLFAVLGVGEVAKPLGFVYKVTLAGGRPRVDPFSDGAEHGEEDG
jgi:hypothetical protein